MIAVALAAVLQYGSCQSGGPDRSRTSAEVANIFLQGLVDRDFAGVSWVTRPGALWRSGDTVRTDAEFYAALRADEWPRRRMVVTGLIVNRANAAATATVRGDPSSERLIVLDISEGCVTEVRTFEPTPPTP